MKSSVYKNAKGCWVCDFYSLGKRHRSFLSTKTAAEESALFARSQAVSTGEVWMSLPVSEKMATAMILAEIKQAGYTLAQVWERFKTRSSGAIASRLF